MKLSKVLDSIREDQQVIIRVTYGVDILITDIDEFYETRICHDLFRSDVSQVYLKDDYIVIELYYE